MFIELLFTELQCADAKKKTILISSLAPHHDHQHSTESDSVDSEGELPWGWGRAGRGERESVCIIKKHPSS